jgi:hypothetical protein
MAEFFFLAFTDSPAGSDEEPHVLATGGSRYGGDSVSSLFFAANALVALYKRIGNPETYSPVNLKSLAEESLEDVGDLVLLDENEENGGYGVGDYDILIHIGNLKRIVIEGSSLGESFKEAGCPDSILHDKKLGLPKSLTSLYDLDYVTPKQFALLFEACPSIGKQGDCDFTLLKKYGSFTLVEDPENEALNDPLFPSEVGESYLPDQYYLFNDEPVNLPGEYGKLISRGEVLAYYDPLTKILVNKGKVTCFSGPEWGVLVLLFEKDGVFVGEEELLDAAKKEDKNAKDIASIIESIQKKIAPYPQASIDFKAGHCRLSRPEITTDRPALNQSPYSNASIPGKRTHDIPGGGRHAKQDKVLEPYKKDNPELAKALSVIDSYLASSYDKVPSSVKQRHYANRPDVYFSLMNLAIQMFLLKECFVSEGSLSKKEAAFLDALANVYGNSPFVLLQSKGKNYTMFAEATDAKNYLGNLSEEMMHNSVVFDSLIEDFSAAALELKPIGHDFRKEFILQGLKPLLFFFISLGSRPTAFKEFEPIFVSDLNMFAASLMGLEA